MSENLATWNRFADIDPKFTKPITGKAYRGTSPNPQYVIRCLTELFGPVGKGFGWEVLQEGFTPLGEEILHWCRIRFWTEDRSNTFESYGQTKALMKTKNGLMSDEDAPKKSLTDAIVKASSHVGIAANIFLGRWDDQKYVAEVDAGFREKEDPSPRRQVGINPQTGMATAHALKKDKGPDNWDAFQAELLECETGPALTKLALGWSTIAERDLWPTSWRELAREEINKRRGLLKNSAPDDDVFPGDRTSNYVSTIQAG